MKSLFFFLLFLLAVLQLKAQDTITIVDAKNSYARSSPKVTYDPAQSTQLIIVSFESEPAANNAKSKLTFNADQDHPQAEKTLVKASKDNINPKNLLFSIPVSHFANQDVANVIITLDGTVKTKFPIAKKAVDNKDSEGEHLMRAVKPDHSLRAIIDTFTYNNATIVDTGTSELFSKRNILLSYNIDSNKVRSSIKSPKALKVGRPLSFQLNPVPNPAKFDVSINGDYVNHNDSTTSELEKYLLNPFAGFTQTTAKSGGIQHTENYRDTVLGYLQAMNTAIIKFLQYYREEQEFIDISSFKADKRKLEKGIDTLLNKIDGYPGNMTDFILNEFRPIDTIFTNPILRNYATFKDFNVSKTYISIASLGNYDELGITVKVVPKANKITGFKPDSVTNRIPLKIYNGLKVDVSTGLFFSFIDQPSYSIRKDSTVGKSSTGSDSTTSRYGNIVKESGTNGKVGFASMIHIYSRWGTDVNVALSLGAGLTLSEDPQLRYMGGVSVLFGRINRVALTFGYMAGQVKELSDVYLHDDQSYRTVPGSETTLATKKVMKGGAFLALSYNFPLLKRKK